MIAIHLGNHWYIARSISIDAINSPLQSIEKKLHLVCHR